MFSVCFNLWHFGSYSIYAFFLVCLFVKMGDFLPPFHILSVFGNHIQLISYKYNIGQYIRYISEFSCSLISVSLSAPNKFIWVGSYLMHSQIKASQRSLEIFQWYLGPSGVAVLDPAQVDSTETVPGDACESMVVVLVNVGIEGGIQVDVVLLCTSPQTVFHGLISQPLFQFGRGDNIVDNPLKPGQDDPFGSYTKHICCI